MFISAQEIDSKINTINLKKLVVKNEERKRDSLFSLAKSIKKETS